MSPCTVHSRVSFLRTLLYNPSGFAMKTLFSSTLSYNCAIFSTWIMYIEIVKIAFITCAKIFSKSTGARDEC